MTQQNKIQLFEERKVRTLWDDEQGIYLCEFRNRGGGRNIVATIIG